MDISFLSTNFSGVWPIVFTSVIVLVFIVFILPRLFNFLNSNVKKEHIEILEDLIKKAKAFKASIDTNPEQEDLIERMLKYSEYAVLAAGQVYSLKEQNALKKEYALRLALNLLEQFKKNNEKIHEKNVTELERNILNGLIETVIAVQKKIQMKDQKTS